MNKDRTDYPTIGELRERLKVGGDLLYPSLPGGHVYRLRIAAIVERGVVCDVMSDDFTVSHGHRDLYEWHERAKLR